MEMQRALLFCLLSCFTIAQADIKGPVRIPKATTTKAVKTTTVKAKNVIASPIRVLLIPEKETTLSSAISARVNKLDGNLGKSFKKNSLLISFDCSEALARAGMSRADLAGAIDQHEAKVKMQGLDQASDVEVSIAASEANKAKARLYLHKAQAAQCKIYAPWNGRISQLHVKNHMTVSSGQPLMEIVKNGPLKLKLNIPSKFAPHIKKENKFVVNIDETKKSYPAYVIAINSRIDPISQTIEIEAKFKEQYSELLPGMSGEAYLTSFN